MPSLTVEGRLHKAVMRFLGGLCAFIVSYGLVDGFLRDYRDLWTFQDSYAYFMPRLFR